MSHAGVESYNRDLFTYLIETHILIGQDMLLCCVKQLQLIAARRKITRRCQHVDDKKHHDLGRSGTSMDQGKVMREYLGSTEIAQVAQSVDQALEGRGRSEKCNVQGTQSLHLTHYLVLFGPPNIYSQSTVIRV